MSLRSRVVSTLGALLAGLLLLAPGTADAGRGDRTLKLYFTHTKEKGEFTFRRNGRYDKKELERINVFLRDWRRGEPTKMDPQLLDLIWEVHRQTGSNEYIHIVSAYRSLETNNALRKRGRGVAQRSQHTRGKAMDFFIPGVPVAKLRAIGLQMQQGGVGYYPSSGSPFVHLDTGNVRHWPRMTRKQLIAVFPNGGTLHVPSDGKPLPGYEVALAKYKSGKSIAVASAAGSERDGGRTATAWLKDVFSGGPDEEEDASLPAAPARRAPPAPAEPVIAAEPAPVAPSVPAAEPIEPAAEEPPSVVPAPRPAVPEIAVAAAEVPAEAEAAPAVAAAPTPREAPLVVRQILLAASERAAEIGAAPVQVAAAPLPEPSPVGSAPSEAAPTETAPTETAMTAVEAAAAQAASTLSGEEPTPAVALAFAAVPKGRPASRDEAPAAAEAAGVPIDPDQALASLYETTRGGNPEGGPQAVAAAEAEGEETRPEELLATQAEAMQRLASVDFDAPLAGLPKAPVEEASAEGEAASPPLMTASLTVPFEDGEARAALATEGEPAARVAPPELTRGTIEDGEIARFMSGRRTGTAAFATLSMPSPTGAHGLFAAASDASATEGFARR